jgi:hypothetical protein
MRKWLHGNGTTWRHRAEVTSRKSGHKHHAEITSRQWDHMEASCGSDVSEIGSETSCGNYFTAVGPHGDIVRKWRLEIRSQENIMRKWRHGSGTTSKHHAEEAARLWDHIGILCLKIVYLLHWELKGIHTIQQYIELQMHTVHSWGRFVAQALSGVVSSPVFGWF